MKYIYIYIYVYIQPTNLPYLATLAYTRYSSHSFLCVRETIIPLLKRGGVHLVEKLGEPPAKSGEVRDTKQPTVPSRIPT